MKIEKYKHLKLLHIHYNNSYQHKHCFYTKKGQVFHCEKDLGIFLPH